MCEKSLQPGEVGVLQNLNRSALNGMVAVVTGGLKRRMLYSLTNPADSEICMAYKVSVPGHPRVHARIDWCVKAHQIRRLDDPDGTAAEEQMEPETGFVGT